MQKEKISAANAVTFCCLTALMMLLNTLCPYLSDDWHFLFVWEDFQPLPTTERVTNLQEILLSMQNYYQKSGGRVIPHFLTYCFMTQEKWLFNLLNSIMFSWLCCLIYQMAIFQKKQHSFLLFPLISLFVIVSVPAFGDDVLWLSGATNYLWPAVLLLCCFHWLMTKWETAQIRAFFMMLPVFMLSSATNEVTGGMLLTGIWLRMAMAERRHIRRGLLLSCALLPGMGLVLLAPGNTVRRNTIEQSPAPRLWELPRTVMTYFNYLYYHHRILVMICVFTLFLSVFLHERLGNLCRRWFLIFVGLSGTAALGALGFFAKRPVFFGVCLLIPGVWREILWTAEQYQDRADAPKAFWLPFLQSLLLTSACLLLFSASDLVRGAAYLLIPCLTALFLLAGIALVLPRLTFPDISYRPRLSALLQGIAVLCLVRSLVTGLTEYWHWSAEYHAYQEELIRLVQDGALTEARQCAITYNYQHNNAYSEQHLIPDESYRVSSSYAVAWLAAYYDQDVTDFVQNESTD